MELELESLGSKYSDALKRAIRAEAELETLKPAHLEIKNNLDDAKRNLEEETLKRVDLQNQQTSLEENSKFEIQTMQNQLNDKQTESTENDGRLAKQYEESLAELRHTYETQISDNCKIYDKEIGQLQANLETERFNTAGIYQEVEQCKTKIESLTTQNAELESANASLVRDMNEMAAKFNEEMSDKDAELRNKDEKVDTTIKDYMDLKEIKEALEIAVYREFENGESLKARHVQV